MKSLNLFNLVLLSLSITESSASILDILEGSQLGKYFFVNGNVNSSSVESYDLKLENLRNDGSTQEISSNNEKNDEDPADLSNVKTLEYSAVKPDEMYDEDLKLQMLNEFVDSYFEELKSNEEKNFYDIENDVNNRNIIPNKTSEFQKSETGKQLVANKTIFINETSQTVAKILSTSQETIMESESKQYKVQNFAENFVPGNHPEAYLANEIMKAKLLSVQSQKKLKKPSKEENGKNSNVNIQNLPKSDQLYNNNNLNDLREPLNSAKNKWQLNDLQDYESLSQDDTDPWNIGNVDDELIDSEFNEKLMLSNNFFGSSFEKRDEISEEEKKDCMPQNLEEFIKNSKLDNSQITVKYFEEDEVDSVLEINKRHFKEAGTQFEVMSNRNRYRKSESEKFKQKSPEYLKSKTPNLKDQEKILNIKDSNNNKFGRMTPKKGYREVKERDFGIGKGRNYMPSYSNNQIFEDKPREISVGRKNPLIQRKNIPQNMWPFISTEEDNYYSGLPDFSDISKTQWKEHIYFDGKDDTIDWEQYDRCDTYDDDCDDLESIKEFVHDKSNSLHQEQKRIIGEVINVLYHLNDGKHKGINFLFEALGMITDEVFLVLKTFIVLIHRLTEAGFDGIKLVLQCIIEGENMILTQFEDDCKCECDCSKKRGRILNHLNLLFFFHPSPTTTYKSTEIVEHLKQLFGIYENPGECWCDCYCDDRKGNFFKAYSLEDIDIQFSPFMTNVFHQSNNENRNIENEAAYSLSNDATMTNLHKKKRSRHHKKALESQKSSYDIINEKVFNVTDNNVYQNFSSIDGQRNKTNGTTLVNVESFASKSGINHFVFLIQFILPIFFLQ